MSWNFGHRILFGDRSLGARLLRQFLLLGVVPVLAVFATTWWLLVPVLVEQAEARNRELALAVRDQVALQFDLRLHAAEVLAQSLQGQAAGDVQRGLDAAVRVDRFLQGAFSVDDRGRVAAAALATGATRAREDTIGLDLTAQPHVAQARSSRRPAWSDAFLSTLTGGLTAALAIPSGDGLLVQELSVTALSRSVGELARTGGSQVVIVDRVGHVIAHPDERQARQQESLLALAPVRDALRGRDVGARLGGPSGGQLVHALPVSPIGWAVVVSRPVATVMEPLRNLAFGAAAVLALTIVVAAVVGWRMARQTGKEVALLADGAQRAAEDRDPPSLQFASTEFNAVWTRLRELFRQLKERGEQTLEAQRSLQAVLDAATQVAIVATDRDGIVTVFNIGAQRLLGWSEAEVVGRLTPLTWLDGGEVHERGATLERKQGLPVTGFEVLVFEARHRGDEVRDWRFVRRDGNGVDVSLAVTAMRDAGGELTGFLLVAIDITERRRMEQLELARRGAEAANQAKTQFLSRMSHELRTPLNAILGYAQLLETEVQLRLPPAQHAHLEHILSAGWHLLRLIEDVLELARIEAGGLRMTITPVSLTEVFDRAVQLVHPLLQPLQVELSVEHDGQLPHVEADETRLVQVLVNLIGNAAKYNRRHGSVRLSAQDTPAGVRIAVRDTGAGMSSEQLAQLFEPFNRLGRESSGIEGTGIGLVITRHLVELMHGRIEVTSELGRGTTFEVWLPRATEDTSAVPPLTAETPAPASADATSGGRVLYIEDNEINAQLMRAFMRQRPSIALQICTDAATGIAAARHERPDLILLDMHLPDADGDAVLAELRADRALSSLPIVVVSADATQARIAEMRAYGVREYLTKPLRLAATLRVIDEALTGRVESAARTQ